MGHLVTQYDYSELFKALKIRAEIQIFSYYYTVIIKVSSNISNLLVEILECYIENNRLAFIIVKIHKDLKWYECFFKRIKIINMV